MGNMAKEAVFRPLPGADWKEMDNIGDQRSKGGGSTKRSRELVEENKDAAVKIFPQPYERDYRGISIGFRVAMTAE